MIAAILLVCSSGLLGIFLGAQLAEAFLFVPYWKKLSPNHFFELHKAYGKKIYAFFAPLTILATVLPLVTVVYHLIYVSKEHLFLVLLGVSTLLFFSTYYIYFKKANSDFATRSISDHELSHALATWEKWHWLRIFFECIAFGTSLVILLKF